jgi:hypothetical protein
MDPVDPDPQHWINYREKISDRRGCLLWLVTYRVLNGAGTFRNPKLFVCASVTVSGRGNAGIMVVLMLIGLGYSNVA